MRTFLLVDGENFKKKIEAVFMTTRKIKPDWNLYDFKRLMNDVLQGITLEKSLFYIARIKMDERTRDKSKELIENQRKLKTSLEQQKFIVIAAGHVRGRSEPTGAGNALVFREKGVDVKIAVDMVRYACDKEADQLIIASSDSDLQPAIEEVKRRNVKLLYLGFEQQPNKGLMYTTDKTILLRDSEVLCCQN